MSQYDEGSQQSENESHDSNKQQSYADSMQDQSIDILEEEAQKTVIKKENWIEGFEAYCDDDDDEVTQEKIKMMENFKRHHEVNKRVKQEKMVGKDMVTVNVLTMNEFARVAGLRARQIIKGSGIYVDLTPEERLRLGPLGIAEQQIYEQKCPYYIIRILPNGDYQEWNLKDMICHPI